MSHNKTLLIRCEQDLLDDLDSFAKKMHFNRSQAVRMILYSALERGRESEPKLLTANEVAAQHNYFRDV